MFLFETGYAWCCNGHISTVIGWALPELIRHPQVMDIVEDELENVVGLDRMVEESDLVHLEYFLNGY